MKWKISFVFELWWLGVSAKLLPKTRRLKSKSTEVKYSTMWNVK